MACNNNKIWVALRLSSLAMLVAGLALLAYSHTVYVDKAREQASSDRMESVDDWPIAVRAFDYCGLALLFAAICSHVAAPRWRPLK